MVCDTVTAKISGDLSTSAAVRVPLSTPEGPEGTIGRRSHSLDVSLIVSLWSAMSCDDDKALHECFCYGDDGVTGDQGYKHYKKRKTRSFSITVRQGGWCLSLLIGIWTKYIKDSTCQSVNGNSMSPCCFLSEGENRKL